MSSSTTHASSHLFLRPEFQERLGGLPMLVGPSRKRFIGEAIRRGSGGERSASDRDWGTAAAVRVFRFLFFFSPLFLA